MANNENTVQIQVEVLRAQLDKLIADINSLKTVSYTHLTLPTN